MLSCNNAGMDWNDLRYVLAVARRRTLAAAGRDLNVDSTTVGRRLLAIEGQLGTRLFERTSDGFEPTHTGEITIARAEEIEIQTLALLREVEGSDSRIEGPVRITALDMLLDDLIIPRLPQLWTQHPGLELTLVSDIRLFDLSRREADIGIRYSKPTHADLVGRRLGRQATGLYVAREFEIGDSPPLITLPKELAEIKEARALHEYFPRGRIVARANTESHMMALVLAGVGIGLLDCFSADADPRLRRAVADPVLTDEIWAIVHVDMHRAKRVRAVIDFITEIVAEESDRLEGRCAQ